VNYYLRWNVELEVATIMMNLSVNEVSYSNDEHINGEMPPWGYTLAAVVLFFIGFFGFFLNLIALVLMCKDVKVSFK